MRTGDECTLSITAGVDLIDASVCSSGEPIGGSSGVGSVAPFDACLLIPPTSLLLTTFLIAGEGWAEADGMTIRENVIN